MLGQLLDAVRFAAPLQIGRRGAQRHAVIADAPRHQPIAVGQRAVADRHIETVLNQIHHPIAERQLQLQAGMLTRQLGQQRRDAHAAKQHRHRYPQPATDLPLARLQQRFRAADLLQRPQATLIEQRAVVGQALATGGAMKQSHAQPLFQPGDRFPHRRARQVQPNGRQRKTARLHGGDEYRNAAQSIAHGLSL